MAQKHKNAPKLPVSKVMLFQNYIFMLQADRQLFLKEN